MIRPDLTEGLRQALELPLSDGNAVDLGAGSGMYIRPLVQSFPGRTTAYDSNHTRVDDLQEKLAEEWLTAEVILQNVLGLSFAPNSLAVATVGMTIFIPKDTARELFVKLWAALKSGGILHAEFATHQDEAEQTDFVQVGCIETSEGSGSYHHWCGPGYGYCQHISAGILGGSFWHEAEVMEFLRALGEFVLVHKATYEWQQKITEDGVTETLHRSYFVVTVQKL